RVPMAIEGLLKLARLRIAEHEAVVGLGFLELHPLFACRLAAPLVSPRGPGDLSVLKQDAAELVLQANQVLSVLKLLGELDRIGQERHRFIQVFPKPPGVGQIGEVMQLQALITQLAPQLLTPGGHRIALTPVDEMTLVNRVDQRQCPAVVLPPDAEIDFGEPGAEIANALDPLLAPGLEVLRRQLEHRYLREWRWLAVPVGWLAERDSVEQPFAGRGMRGGETAAVLANDPPGEPPPAERPAPLTPPKPP